METPFQKIKKWLDEKGIHYQLFEHEPVFTSEQLANTMNVPLGAIAKSLLLKAPAYFVLAVLPGDKRLDMKKMKELLYVKNFRFAKPEEVIDIMGCEIGACYPFGNIINVRTLVDQALSTNNSIHINPGVHDRTLTIQWNDFKAINYWEIVDMSQQ